jgi:HD-GYP domain-containing protein (c-di-GMP phosphodiesterase class II)
MKLDVTQIYLAEIIESALLDLDIQLTPAEWQIIQHHVARLEQALQEVA